MATTVYMAIIEREEDLYAALCPELDVASQGGGRSKKRLPTCERQSRRHAARHRRRQRQVPIPDHRELAIGTLLSIIRQSGIPRAEFEE